MRSCLRPPAARSGDPADPQLISDLHSGTMPTIALDAQTGRERWRSAAPDPGSSGSSKVIDVGGQRLLVQNTGTVLAVADGRTVLSLAQAGGDNYHHGQQEPAVDDATDTVCLIPSKGQGVRNEVVAFRLALRGDSLSATLAWRSPIARAGHTLAVHQGCVYTGCDAIDLATGAVTSWTKDSRPKLPTRWMLAIANGHLYGLDTDGVAKVFSLDGRLVATNKLISQTSDPELIARHLAIDANEQMGHSYASPIAIAGDRLLLRSYDHLYCIAATSP